MHILLLTATVTPRPGVPSLVRTDPQTRLRDYEDAFVFYLTLLGEAVDRIVFVENSGSDIGTMRRLAEQANKAELVEFLVFDGLDYPPEYDRGYGEMKLVDHFMAHSAVVASAGEHCTIWKCTGRYKVENLAQIIAQRPSAFDLYCNLRNRPRRVADMYLMAWTPAGHDRYLKGCYEDLNVTRPGVAAGTHAEELMRLVIDRHDDDVRIVRRFRSTPAVNGVRGGDNRNYLADGSWKFLARRIARVITPSLWV